MSHHYAASPSIPAPAVEDKNALIKYTDKKYPLPCIDLAIGSRVRVTQNIATQIGIYQGAMGTVNGSGFRGQTPQVITPTGDNMEMAQHNDREISTVFVEMDNESIPCSFRPTIPQKINQ